MVGATLLAGSYSVENDCDNHKRNSECEKRHIALEGSLSHLHAKVVEHSEHQGEAASQREGHGHTGDGGGSAEKDVGSIEYEASEHYPSYIGNISLCDILEETASLRAEAAECERKKQGEDNHSEHIVPVEEFVSPTLGCGLLGISPGAPAEHNDEAENYCERITVNDYHNVLVFDYLISDL